MKMTATQKIFARHAGRKSVTEGELLTATVDIVLGNDITAPVAVRELEKAGGKVQTLEAPFPEAALCADTARSRNTITAYVRRSILESLLDAGV